MTCRFRFRFFISVYNDFPFFRRSLFRDDLDFYLGLLHLSYYFGRRWEVFTVISSIFYFNMESFYTLYVFAVENLSYEDYHLWKN